MIGFLDQVPAAAWSPPARAGTHRPPRQSCGPLSVSPTTRFPHQGSYHARDLPDQVRRRAGQARRVPRLAERSSRRDARRTYVPPGGPAPGSRGGDPVHAERWESHEDVLEIQLKRPYREAWHRPFQSFSARRATSRSGNRCARTCNGPGRNPRCAPGLPNLLLHSRERVASGEGMHPCLLPMTQPQGCLSFGMLCRPRARFLPTVAMLAISVRRRAPYLRVTFPGGLLPGGSGILFVSTGTSQLGLQPHQRSGQQHETSE